MNVLKTIQQYLGNKPTKNQLSNETEYHNPVNINRLCDLQNRNDHNFKLIRSYINKQTGVTVNQMVLYEIALDYLLTHEKGTPIVEIIQKYKIYE